jgi:hypothetical protein
MSSANNALKTLVNEKLSIRYSKALDEFKKKKYLLPKGCSRTLIADSFLASKHGAEIYFPKIKELRNQVQDYTITIGGAYSYNQEALDVYGRRFANISMSAMRLITEMVVLDKTGKNLWCEGNVVEPHYYLIILSALANDVYQRFKQDTKEVTPFIKGDLMNQWLKTERDFLSKKTRDQVGTIMNLVDVNSKRTKLVEAQQSSHRFIEAQLTAYLNSDEQSDKLNTFLKAAYLVSEGHALLKTCPTSDERFAMFTTAFPDLMIDYHARTGNAEFEGVPAYAIEMEGCDLSDELIKTLTDIMEAGNFSSKRKFDTMLPNNVAHPFGALFNENDGMKPTRLERVRMIAKKLNGTNTQLSDIDLKDFIAEGWNFDSRNTLVNAAMNLQNVNAVNMRQVLRTPYVIGLQSKARDRVTVEKVTDSARFFRASGIVVADYDDKLQPLDSSKDLIENMMRQTELSKPTSVLDGAITAAISEATTACFEAAIDKCNKKKTLMTLRALVPNLLPELEMFNRVFARHYTREFCSSSVYQTVISKRNSGLTLKMDEILATKMNEHSDYLFRDQRRLFYNIIRPVFHHVFEEYQDFAQVASNKERAEKPVMSKLKGYLQTCMRNIDTSNKKQIQELIGIYEQIKQLGISSSFELFENKHASVSAGGMTNASAAASANVKDIQTLKDQAANMMKVIKKQKVRSDKQSIDEETTVLEAAQRGFYSVPAKPVTANPSLISPIATEKNMIEDELANTPATDKYGSVMKPFDLFANLKPKNHKPRAVLLESKPNLNVIQPVKLPTPANFSWDSVDFTKYPMDAELKKAKTYILQRMGVCVEMLKKLYPNDVAYMKSVAEAIMTAIESEKGDIDDVFTNGMSTVGMIREVIVSCLAPALMHVRMHRARADIHKRMSDKMLLSPMTLAAFLLIESVLRNNACEMMTAVAPLIKLGTLKEFETFKLAYINIMPTVKVSLAALLQIQNFTEVHSTAVFDCIRKLFINVTNAPNCYSFHEFGCHYIATPLLWLLTLEETKYHHNIIFNVVRGTGAAYKNNTAKQTLRSIYSNASSGDTVLSNLIKLTDDFLLIAYRVLYRNATTATYSEMNALTDENVKYAISYKVTGRAQEYDAFCLLAGSSIYSLGSWSIQCDNLIAGLVGWVDSKHV